MSKLIFTSNFTGETLNFDVMNAKNTIDKESSVLKGFLLENKIDLVADALAEASAQLHEDNRQHILDVVGSQQKLVKNNISVPWSVMLEAAQFLKSHYKDNVKSLAVWGITINNNGKITYPHDLEGKLELVDAFWSYHSSQTNGTSVLATFIATNVVDVPKIIANIISAKTIYAALLQNNTDEQQESGERERIWAPVWKNTKRIGAHLMKLYVNNTKMVCDWGYNVVDAVSKQKLRTTNLILGSKITIAGNVLGSTMSNLGTDDLHIYKGKTTVGNPIIVKAGANLGLVKGFSTITVVNPSVVVAGKFSTLVNK